MRNQFLACSFIFAFAAAATEPITIYPIDRASIAVEAKFDFKIEFPETTAETDVEIKIGGKPVSETLGTPGSFIEESFGKPKKTATAFIARDCAFHAENSNVLVEVFVRKEKAGEVTWRVFTPRATGKTAKNVILMIGDGMSQAHRTAARIMSKGMKQGKYNGSLAMDDMPHMGLVGTSGMDSIITDSANSATAYTTGHKSVNGALGVYRDRTTDYDAKPAPGAVDDPACESIASLARRLQGKAVGIVTDAEIQDATPASMYAHIAHRRLYEPISDMLAASDFDVILGGGRDSFTQKQFESFRPRGYAVCETRSELLSAGTPTKLFGIFNPKNIDGVWDRKFLKNFKPAEQNDQPDLTEMAASALAVLDTKPNGFVLMIESARIDKFSHSLDWERAVMDTIMFDQTIALVKEFAARRDDTLVLVLSDHTHGVSIVGTLDDSPPHTTEIVEYDSETKKYVKKTVPKQGRDCVRIYGEAGFPNYTIKDGFPETLNVTRRLAVFFTNFPDYYEIFSPKFGGEFKPTVDVSAGKGTVVSIPNDIYKSHPDAMLRAGNLPRGAHFDASREEKTAKPYGVPGGVHTCEDSIVTAIGPGSEAVRGFLDNTKIFEIMANALDLNTGKARR